MLLNHNPNSANPQRLTPAQALTCDQDHGYTAEQTGLDSGLMDKFVEKTGVSTCSPPDFSAPGLVMDYYDGNTVTGLWNYAQRFAMSDNCYDTEFGPSTPGALNLISGQTGGGTSVNAPGRPSPTRATSAPPNATTDTGTVYGDPDPFYDGCANHCGPTVKMSGRERRRPAQQRRASAGAGSRAASRRRRDHLERHAGVRRAPQQHRRRVRQPTTARTTTRSSTTPRPPTRTTAPGQPGRGRARRAGQP